MPAIKSWREHQGEVVDSAKGFDVIECQTCGFKHVIPIPTLEELDKLYKDKFYSTEKPRYFKDVEEDLEWWEMTYRNYYQLFEKYCQKKGRRLLEIGSGPGYFLKYGRELGWNVLGFEPSKQAYEYSQKFGVKVANEFFNETSAGKYGKFDAVYMNTVIEHLPDPASLISTTKSVLNPNGIICIISPNDYNPLQNILRDNLTYEPWWVAPPQHINYFDFESIKKLLERLGFEIIESTGTFPMEFFLLSGDNYVGNDELGRKCHFKRKIFEGNMYKYGNEYLNSIYKFLAANGIGREFVVIGRVKDEI
jgi:SAM-dependent methyltransferase